MHFVINAPFESLQGLLGGALAGLHTMWNEHFGIRFARRSRVEHAPDGRSWPRASSVVEFMAAGVIAVAHNSGGPRVRSTRSSDRFSRPAPSQADIVGTDTEPTKRAGFLAATAEEYASALAAIYGGCRSPMRS